MCILAFFLQGSYHLQGIYNLQGIDHREGEKGQMTKKRMYSIDNLRGLMMLCIILGHVLLGFEDMLVFSEKEEMIRSFVKEYLYCFHVPVFFALSGYFFCKYDDMKWRDYGTFIKNKAITILVPYVLCSVVFWGMRRLASSFLQVEYTLTDLLNIWKTPMSFMWYLYAFFLVQILAGLFACVCKKEWMKWILFLLSFGVAALYKETTGILALDYLKNYMVYFYLGYFLSRIEKPRTKRYLFAATLAAHLAALLTREDFESVKMVLALTACTFLIMLFTQMPEEEKIPVLYSFGEYGMPIYIMHAPVVGAVRIVLVKMGVTAFLPHLILGFFIPCVVCYFLYVGVIKRIRILNFFFYPQKVLQK